MDKILGIFSFIKGWISARLKERTSWDGAALIAAGVCFLLFKGVATIVAYAAIAYGAWTLWKKEYKD
jgi:TRAP-type mannitol/chloroaromatic compound transport system permease small subunit